GVVGLGDGAPRSMLVDIADRKVLKGAPGALAIAPRAHLFCRCHHATLPRATRPCPRRGGAPKGGQGRLRGRQLAECASPVPPHAHARAPKVDMASLALSTSPLADLPKGVRHPTMRPPREGR